MFFRRIPCGSFRMGSRGWYAAEEPIHEVAITREFYLGTFVVTQEQYMAVARRCPALKKTPDPSYFKGLRLPVETVSWQDADAFCEWLLARKKLPKNISEVRLPTEAEWEYACRAGKDTEYYNGDGQAALAEVGWFDGNSGSTTHAVDEPIGGRPEKHPFGLHGMHGNVWEWCRDAWDAEAYRKCMDGVEDPETKSLEDNQHRVLRGGSWLLTASRCRSAYRFRNEPDGRLRDFGFRVCLVCGPAADRTDRVEPEPVDGGRGTRTESKGAGGAGIPDLTKERLPRLRESDE